MSDNSRSGGRRARIGALPLFLVMAVVLGLLGYELISALRETDAISTPVERPLDDPGPGGAAEPAPSPSPSAPTVEKLIPRILAVHPHDPAAFTQGLVLHGGDLFESTGLNGRSSLRRVDLETGEVLQLRELDARYFGEGLAVVDDTLVQLTWKAGTAFVYDRATFEPLGSHAYDGEGWGLCFDGRWLVMSDGSNELTFRDPMTFDAVGGVPVTLDGRPVADLNELECVGDRVLANIWQTDLIVAVDSATGVAVSVIDASELRRDAEASAEGRIDVLNGIAHLPASDTYLLTGKLWPRMYEVRLVAAE